ncbi:hypothetical protein BV898_17990 [Hypsibius exemplaris]|uniref:Uncharacterized protein n=1 Tax=Hypsibius exemplaris TaxID=2072580 RepID=A0A9X6NGJ3_HYPEX|nr:hypothetical protein BV898_17990 [Hypsibius exemplaris]
MRLSARFFYDKGPLNWIATQAMAGQDRHSSDGRPGSPLKRWPARIATQAMAGQDRRNDSKPVSAQKMSSDDDAETSNFS